jgi:hypothetical protein
MKTVLWPELALACLLRTTIALLAGCTSVNDKVTVTLEKQIKAPGIDEKSTLTVLTQLAWSEVTNQIAAAPLAGSQLYLIDPDTGRGVEFDAQLSGITEANLMWSRRRPLLVASSSTDVLVLDTSAGADKAPKPVRRISNVKPHPLIADGAGLVDLDGDEWVVVAGDTNRIWDPANPEIAAHSISTGERKLAWQFPSDGDRYYFERNKLTAAVVRGEPAVFAWVKHIDEHDRNALGPSDWEEVWVVRPRNETEGCKLRPRPKHPPPPSFHLGDTGRLAVSSDGRWFAFSTDGYKHYGYDDAVLVHDTADCSLVHKITFDEDPTPDYLAFSPDGRWLLGTSPVHHGTPAGRIYLWRTSDWKLVYRSVANVPYQAAFNKDSSRFAIATAGGLYIYRITSH